MDSYGMHSWGMGAWMSLWWIFIIIIIIIIGASSMFYRQNGRPSEKSAMDILKERYAKGEISKQEFEDKKNDIL